MIGRKTVLWGPVVLMMVTAAQAGTIDYFDFSVVSLGDIGSSSREYKGDVEGRAAALGSAWFKGVNLHGQFSGPHTPYSLYAGGDVKLTGTVYNGGIEAGGNVTIQGGSVHGPIASGGSLLGNGGTIDGDVTLTGQNLAGPGLSIAGALSEGMPWSPSLDLQSLEQFFTANAAAIGAMTDTLVPVNNGGQLGLQAVSGLNVVTLTGSELQSAGSLRIDGPSDAIVYINVAGSAVTLDGLSIDYASGMNAGRVLANLSEATSLELRGHQTLNILAPYADTYFASGVLHGNLIVGELSGKGDVHRQGSYSGGVPLPTPEPASLMLLLLSGTLLLTSRRHGSRR